MKFKIFAGTCLLLAALFAGGGFLYKNHQSRAYDFLAQNNASTFIRDHSPTRGSDDAKVFLIEFMDPACKTCAVFSPLIKQIMDAHPGKIKLVMRYAPFYDGAEYVLKILEAARKQDKYWETLEVIFRTQSVWAGSDHPHPEKIWQFLPKVGLDLDQIKTDMNDPAIEKIIAQDLADARTLNVRKVPGFFVNGKPLETFGRQQLYDLILSQIDVQY